ncbi:hypothetical protein E1A91_A12G261400v1 [Gossypium mustelinum]|uniref:Uncharacterized protein n=1 Tax=Gossypium mustelinum TaxID=34275 RepID=A0A5D2WYP4_GOSMU|nr:hypothetical protein E1A91_A12G261400v1 [Gossypium mustelinum]
MCRSVDYYDFRSGDQSLLKIKAFFVRFSDFDSCADPLSDSLILLFPPRINDTARLEISGSITRPGSPAFVTLHRLVKLKTRDGEAIYGSRERIRAGDGVRFEVYSREEKVLNGVLRREEEKWKMECKCALESDNTEMIGGKAAVADVCVAVEGDLAMGERVEMVVRKCRKNRRMGFDQLEDIPEEREGESERDGGFCCSCGEADSGGEEVDIEAAGVSWAFDVGIWIICFGVGYFVSKATAKSLRRMRLL